MRRPDAVETAEARGHAHRAAGVGAECGVAQTGCDRRGGAGRGTARHTIRRAGVERRAVECVLTQDTKGDLVGDGLADQRRAGIEKCLHRPGMPVGTGCVRAQSWFSAATLSDFSYLSTGIIFVTLLLWLRQGSAEVTDILWALAAANVVAIIMAFHALGVRPRISFRSSVWRRYGAIRSDVGWSLVGASTWSVQSQALLFLVAAIAGPAAYAPIAAGIVLFSPLRPANVALINVFRPEFVAALAAGKLRRLTRMMYSLCAVIILSCVAVGAVIWLGWPYLEAHIFGGKFAGAAFPLIVGLTGLSAVIYLTYFIPLTLI